MTLPGRCACGRIRDPGEGTTLTTATLIQRHVSVQFAPGSRVEEKIVSGARRL
ncbi:MAG TPA: hypothetical protein VFN87_15385 [Solirubrobacteraceae bacterium]|nr:hypothetical protein [Solirubrobacteraceae bacterium]